MDRNLVNHLNSEQRKREEEKKRKQDAYEMNLRKLSKSTSFNAPPDMKSAYAKVLEKVILHTMKIIYELQAT